MVAKHALDTEVKAGEKLVYYVNPADIMLFDLETAEKIIAYRAVSSNVATAKVSTKPATTVTDKEGNTTTVEGTAVGFLRKDQARCAQR